MHTSGQDLICRRQDASTVEASMLQFMGVSLAAPLKELGAVSKDEFEEEMADFQFDGRKPSMGVRSRMKLFAHAARVFCGTEWTVGQQQEYEYDRERKANELEVLKVRTEAAAAQAALTASKTAEAVPAPSLLKGRTVRIKDIADVCRVDECSSGSLPR